MGEVYKATDSRVERTVAIKVLPAELAADPERRERFEREAKAISEADGRIEISSSMLETVVGFPLVEENVFPHATHRYRWRFPDRVR